MSRECGSPSRGTSNSNTSFAVEKTRDAISRGIFVGSPEKCARDTRRSSDSSSVLFEGGGDDAPSGSASGAASDVMASRPVAGRGRVDGIEFEPHLIMTKEIKLTISSPVTRVEIYTRERVGSPH